MTPVQRDALTLVGLMDRPHVAQQLLDCWTPGHIRQVALTLAATVNPDLPVSSVQRVEVHRTSRLHGDAAGPHRCDRVECKDQNRRWECDYRRARRAAARKAA